MDAKYPTAPELPGKHTGHYDEPEGEGQAAASGKIQLIESTKKPEPEPDPFFSDEEAAAIDDENDELNEYVEQPGDPDGVVAQEKMQQWRHDHALPETGPPKRRHPWLKALVALIIIAALAVGAYWYGTNRAGNGAPKQPQTSGNQNQKQVQPAVMPTKHYDSATYTLSFDYPENWTVADTPAKLTVTSPAMSLTGVDGKSVQAHAVVGIQNPQSTVPGYPAAGAVAALTSDKLTYKQPTTIQRAQTYLSYLSYKGSGLDALYITGDNGYQQGQQVPMSDVAKGNPLISVVFETCSTVDCSGTGSIPVTLQASAWANNPAAKDVINLLESIELN